MSKQKNCICYFFYKIGGKFKKFDKPSPDASIKDKVEYLLKRQMSVSGALNAAELSI